jgi:hypothetical protein
MIAESWTELPGGFRIPAGSRELLMEKLIDRALLQLVITLTPGWQTRGGIERDKTAKQRQTERAELDILLRVMVNDFGLRSADGTTEHALYMRLLDLAAERGLVTRHEDDPLYRVRYGYHAWSLLDVMTAERYDREYHGRRTSRLGPRYASGGAGGLL